MLVTGFLQSAVCDTVFFFRISMSDAACLWGDLRSEGIIGDRGVIKADADLRPCV